MSTHHQTLLEEALPFSRQDAERLRGARVLITGASGFLAASLIAYLDKLDRAYDLGLELAGSARRELSEVGLFRFLGLEPRVRWIRASAEATQLPEGAPWIVVHTASYGSPKDYLREPMATYSANTEGLLRLLAQADRTRQFVYFSSAEIYGQAPAHEIPTREDYIGGLSTHSVRSIYGESKRMAEVLGVCVAKQKGVPYTVLRPWNVYGPGQRLEDGRVPVEFVRQCRKDRRVVLLSNGSPTRSFCHVWDAMRQIVATLGRTEEHAVFNIGNGSEEVSILELARLSARACGLEDSCVEYDRNARSEALQRCAPEVSRISGITMPGREYTTLASGMRTLVEWHDFLSR